MHRRSQRAWLESSAAELELSQDVARELCAIITDPLIHCEVLEGLALHLTSPFSLKSSNEAVSIAIEHLWTTFPALTTIDISKPFPDSETALTANFFSRLGFEIRSRLDNPSEHGAVGTPSILANDMVSLAATLWLAPQVEMSIEELFCVISEDVTDNPVKVNTIGRLLAKAKWYDPCVGGGVFPVCILLLLTRFGVDVKSSLPNILKGFDIDPISVTTTYIRVAILLSKLNNQDYSYIRSSLPPIFQVGDSLKLLPEQASSFSLIDVPLKFGSESNVFKELTKIPYSSFDIVVGNPPYVRSDRIDAVSKRFLKEAYPSVSSGQADLYNFFIAHGLLALAPMGILCYVSPASFQKSKYGKKTRQFINHYGAVQAIFDFNELPVFNGVNVHTSVYAIGKYYPRKPILTYSFRDLTDQKPLLLGISQASIIPDSNAGILGWSLEKFETNSILDILYNHSISLKEYTGGIFSGIKTGNKKAYYLSRVEANRLLLDEKTRPFIKPLIRPVSIRTWHCTWDGTHIALVKKGEIIPPDSLLMEHFRRFENSLRSRSDIQGHATWYGLRTCDYYDLFEKPKIIFPDIASKCRFSIDIRGFIVPDGAFMIPTEDYFLLGVLNSCIGGFYFQHRCNSIGDVQNGGRMRFKKTYVEDFPVPLITDSNLGIRDEIEGLVRSLVASEKLDKHSLSRIDLLALKMYNVPENLWSAFLEDY